jgi:hypothetical protein
MFTLNDEENEALVSQNVIPGRGKFGGGVPSRVSPCFPASCEGPVVQVNIAIMRAFVRLRELLSTHADLARKLDAMERESDAQFKVVFDAIRQLMNPPPPESPRRRIGFQKDDLT